MSIGCTFAAYVVFLIIFSLPVNCHELLLDFCDDVCPCTAKTVQKWRCNNVKNLDNSIAPLNFIYMFFLAFMNCCSMLYVLAFNLIGMFNLFFYLRYCGKCECLDIFNKVLVALQPYLAISDRCNMHIGWKKWSVVVCACYLIDSYFVQSRITLIHILVPGRH